MTRRYFTYKANALKAKLKGQVLRFTKGKGYWIAGRPDAAMLTMYDSVNVNEIPDNAQAVAGYVGGRWPTFKQLVHDFPHAFKLSIAVSSRQDAECLDVEPRDATNDEAAAWVRHQLVRGVKRPVVYTSLYNANALMNALHAGGLGRADYRLWTAHYTHRPHRCDSNCGFDIGTKADATQYTDRAFGRNLDASLCSPTFFHQV